MKHTHISERGNSTVEYAILIATISLLALGGLAAIGLGIRNSYNTVANMTPAVEVAATEEEVANSPLPTPTPTPTVMPTPLPTEEPEERPLEESEVDERSRDTSYFFDSFDDGDFEGWFNVQGQGWTLEDDSYCAGPGEHRSFAGDESWDNYIVTVQANLAKGNGYGVYFRTTNAEKANAYIFQFDPGYGKGAFLFRQITNGKESGPFARQYAPKDFNWYNQVRTVSINVQGDTFTAYVDGEQVLQGQHSDYKTGQVGLRTWSSSRVCFDDVTVSPLDTPEDGLVLQR